MSEYVGDIDADQDRPQVFNRGYIVDLPNTRRPSAREYKKPWQVTGGRLKDKHFRTHAEAIHHAHKHARKGNK